MLEDLLNFFYVMASSLEGVRRYKEDPETLGYYDVIPDKKKGAKERVRKLKEDMKTAQRDMNAAQNMAIGLLA